MATTAEIKAVLKMRVDGEKQLKAVAPQLRKASAGMKDFGKASELSSAKVAKTTRSLGDLKLQYIAVAAAVAVGVRMIRGALEAQSEQEAAINKLNLALSNQGNLLPGVSERLQEYAAGLQQITTFGDETILQGQALLATFGMNEEQLKATTEVALDFAAATGRDLTMAINLLGKAFVGETGELSRYGIVIDENIPKNERFAEVMKQLNERFGGQAQATVATFSGKLQQFKNAAGDAQEGLGFFIGQLLDFGSAGGVGIGVMDRIGKVFREDFVLALGLARKAFTSWVGFFLGLWEMLLRRMGQMAGPFGAPFRDAATAIEGWREALKKAGDEMLMQAHAASTAGAETLSFNNAAVVAAASTGALAFKFGSLTNAMNQMGAEAKRTKDLFKETIFELEDYTVGLGTLRDEFGNLMNQVIPVTAGIGDLDQHFVSWNEVAGAATRVMGDVGNILSIFGVEVDSTIGKMTRLISSFMSLAESIGGVLGMFRGGGIGGGGLLGGLGGLLGGGGGSATGAAVGTGAAGGGSGLLGAIGGFLTNPLTAIIGGGLGVGVLIAKLFGKEANIAETVENTFGVELSKGLENTLANLATQTGDLSTAAALGISEIFNEALQSGQADLDLFSERIGDTFSFLERGQIDTTQAQDVLNKAIEQLLPHLDELGPAGEAQLERILGAAERFGIEIANLDALTSHLKKNLASLEFPTVSGGFGGINPSVSPEFVSAQGGFHGMLSKPTLFMGHAGEVAHVDKPSKMPGGMVLNLTFAPVLQNPLQGPDDLERVMIPALTKWFNDERGNLISVIERKIARS